MTKVRVAAAVAAGALVLSMVGIGLANASTRPHQTSITKAYQEIEQRQAKHGMRFAEVVETAQARVSAEEAKAKALAAAASMLERPATSVDVRLVRFSYDRNGPDGKPIAQDRLAWQIIFYGTRTRSQGPAPIGRSERKSVDETVLDRSLTWLLIDATTGEIFATYSASGKVQ